MYLSVAEPHHPQKQYRSSSVMKKILILTNLILSLGGSALPAQNAPAPAPAAPVPVTPAAPAEPVDMNVVS